jgi:hypothetical protein
MGCGLQPRIYSMDMELRTVKANQEILDSIYASASLGLRIPSIAYKAGLRESELRQLMQLDPRAEEAMVAGIADAEEELATVMRTCAMNGDSKAALEILRAKHGWIAASIVKSEITGSNGGPLQLAAVDLRGLSNEEIETMTKLLEKTTT